LSWIKDAAFAFDGDIPLFTMARIIVGCATSVGAQASGRA
jgi:hypothetical protein